MPHEASQETSIPHVQLKLAPFSQFFGIFQNYPSVCYIPLFRNQRVRKIINPKLNFNSHESENLNFRNSIPLFTGKYLQSRRRDAPCDGLFSGAKCVGFKTDQHWKLKFIFGLMNSNQNLSLTAVQLLHVRITLVNAISRPIRLKLILTDCRPQTYGPGNFR